MSNRAGHFLSVLCFYKFGANGRAVLCHPISQSSGNMPSIVREIDICIAAGKECLKMLMSCLGS